MDFIQNKHMRLIDQLGRKCAKVWVLFLRNTFLYICGPGAIRCGHSRQILGAAYGPSLRYELPQTKCKLNVLNTLRFFTSAMPST